MPWLPVALKEINFALHTVHQVRCIDDEQTEVQEGQTDLEGRKDQAGGMFQNYRSARGLFCFLDVMQFGDLKNIHVHLCSGRQRLLS